MFLFSAQLLHILTIRHRHIYIYVCYKFSTAVLWSSSPSTLHSLQFWFCQHPSQPTHWCTHANMGDVGFHGDWRLWRNKLPTLRAGLNTLAHLQVFETYQPDYLVLSMYFDLIMMACYKAMKTQTILIRRMYQSRVSLLPIFISYNLVYRRYIFRGYQWWPYLKLFHPLCGVTRFRFGRLYWVDWGLVNCFKKDFGALSCFGPNKPCRFPKIFEYIFHLTSRRIFLGMETQFIV